MVVSEERLNDLKDILQFIYKAAAAGDMETALLALKHTYKDYPEPEFREIITQFAEQSGILKDTPEPDREPRRPRAREDYKTRDYGLDEDEGLPKRPSDMMDDIRRSQKGGISTRRPKGGMDVFTKTIRVTIPGAISFVQKKISKGWKKGQRFYDEESVSIPLRCGCIIRDDTEIGGICLICDQPSCKQHTYQCSNCNRQICNHDMRKFQEQTVCKECYELIKYELEEKTDTWALDSQKPPESFLHSLFKKNKDKKKEN